MKRDGGQLKYQGKMWQPHKMCSYSTFKALAKAVKKGKGQSRVQSQLDRCLISVPHWMSLVSRARSNLFLKTPSTCCERTFIPSPHVITWRELSTILDLAPLSTSSFLFLLFGICLPAEMVNSGLLSCWGLEAFPAGCQLPLSYYARERVGKSIQFKDEISEGPLSCRPKATFPKKHFQ